MIIIFLDLKSFFNRSLYVCIVDTVSTIRSYLILEFKQLSNHTRKE